MLAKDCYLTAREVVGVLHDGVVQVDARHYVLCGTAVTIHVEVVVLLGHAYALAVMNRRWAVIARYIGDFPLNY